MNRTRAPLWTLLAGIRGGESWLDDPNQRALQGFLRFVRGCSADSERLRPFGERGGASIREPVDPCGTGACEPGPPPP